MLYILSSGNSIQRCSAYSNHMSDILNYQYVLLSIVVVDFVQRIIYVLRVYMYVSVFMCVFVCVCVCMCACV